MEGIAKADENMLYRMFGIDAELLIDHAWGEETTTTSKHQSIQAQGKFYLKQPGAGIHDYDFEGGRLVAKEMADLLCLELVEKGLVTDSISLYVRYSRRLQKKSAHGTITMPVTTSSAKKIMGYTQELFEQIVDQNAPNPQVTLIHLVDEMYQQYDLFTDPAEIEREHKIQKTMLEIKKRSLEKMLSLRE